MLGWYISIFRQAPEERAAAALGDKSGLLEHGKPVSEASPG
jgi:hypothetical protein